MSSVMAVSEQQSKCVWGSLLALTDGENPGTACQREVGIKSRPRSTNTSVVGDGSAITSIALQESMTSIALQESSTCHHWSTSFMYRGSPSFSWASTLDIFNDGQIIPLRKNLLKYLC